MIYREHIHDLEGVSYCFSPGMIIEAVSSQVLVQDHLKLHLLLNLCQPIEAGIRPYCRQHQPGASFDEAAILGEMRSYGKRTVFSRATL